MPDSDDQSDDKDDDSQKQDDNGKNAGDDSPVDIPAHIHSDGLTDDK